MATTPKKPTLRKATGAEGRPMHDGKGMQISQHVIDSIVAGVTDRVLSVQGGEWFGPMQPMRPVAQEEAVGRLRDYAVGYNLRQTPREEEAVSFRQLRALSENCDMLRIVLETRKDQVECIEWDIKVREGHKAPEEHVHAAREFLLQPCSEYDWSGWIRSMLEDLLVLDACAIYPRYTMGGDLYSLDLIDAATIKRVIDDTGRTPLPPSPAYQQQLHGVLAANYSADELVYFMRNPRTHKFYGYSPVEQVITTINIAIRKSLHQLQFFTEGNIPEAIAGVPEGWTTEQIKEFQMYWDALIEGNTAVRRHMRFVPIDPTKIKETKPPELKDMFDEWIARVICFAFSISPSAFIKDTNRATAETVAEQAKIEGLVPLLRFIKRRMDYFLTKYMGLPGLEFHWDMDESIDAKTQADIDKIYCDLKVTSPDELRKERLGKEPMTPEEKEANWPTPVAPGQEIDPKTGKPLPPKLGPDGKPLPAAKPPPFGAAPKGKPKAEDEEEAAAKGYGFIGKLVIAPVITIPERTVNVDVGDVNVTAEIPASLPAPDAAAT